MLAVSESQLLEIRKILKETIPKVTVLAFGSRVSGNYKKTSDLDLLLKSESKLSSLVLGNLRERFELSNLPFRVDILDWHAISEDFRTVINSCCYKIEF